MRSCSLASCMQGRQQRLAAAAWDSAGTALVLGSHAWAHSPYTWLVPSTSAVPAMMPGLGLPLLHAAMQRLGHSRTLQPRQPDFIQFHNRKSCVRASQACSIPSCGPCTSHRRPPFLSTPVTGTFPAITPGPITTTIIQSLSAPPHSLLAPRTYIPLQDSCTHPSHLGSTAYLQHHRPTIHPHHPRVQLPVLVSPSHCSLPASQRSQFHRSALSGHECVDQSVNPASCPSAPLVQQRCSPPHLPLQTPDSSSGAVQASPHPRSALSREPGRTSGSSSSNSSSSGSNNSSSSSKRRFWSWAGWSSRPEPQRQGSCRPAASQLLGAASQLLGPLTQRRPQRRTALGRSWDDEYRCEGFVGSCIGG